jgi:chromosome partitioning protein
LLQADALTPNPSPGERGENQEFDFVLMDCAPSLGVLTLNALCAATEVFIPLQPHFLALHGLGKLLETTALVSKRINPSLRVTGVVLCMCEANTRLAQEVERDLGEFLNNSRDSNVPWSQACVFNARIRRNIKLAEAPSFGKSIFGYAPSCHGAEDYLTLAMEVLGERPPKVIAAKVKVENAVAV